MTVNERLATALKIADENNRRLAVRMAKIEAAITAICKATGIELEFENPEIEEAAKAILGLEPKGETGYCCGCNAECEASHPLDEDGTPLNPHHSIRLDSATGAVSLVHKGLDALAKGAAQVEANV